MRRFFFLPIFFLMQACFPMSSKDLRAKAELETEKLAHLLYKIDTKDELQRKLNQIEESYNKIVDYVLQVKFSNLIDESSEPTKASDALFAELARLYERPGCRFLLETAQEKAILRLKEADISNF